MFVTHFPSQKVGLKLVPIISLIVGFLIPRCIKIIDTHVCSLMIHAQFSAMVFSRTAENIELDIWIPKYRLAVEYHGMRCLIELLNE